MEQFCVFCKYYNKNFADKYCNKVLRESIYLEHTNVKLTDDLRLTKLSNANGDCPYFEEKDELRDADKDQIRYQTIN